jgi:hypothetical protein
MSRGWGTDKFSRPIISFTETLIAGANGTYRERGEYAAFMFKALVVAMDTQGGKLETPTGSPEGDALVQHVEFPNGKVDEYTVANSQGKVNVGPRNPKNSVKARIISNGIDDFVDDDDLRVYWPLLPGIDNPSAGEVVYVVFEDETMNHGLWLCRAPLNGDVDTPNQVLVPPEPETPPPLSSNFPGSSAPSATDAGSSAGTVSPKRDSFRLSRKFVAMPSR